MMAGAIATATAIAKKIAILCFMIKFDGLMVLFFIVQKLSLFIIVQQCSTMFINVEGDSVWTAKQYERRLDCSPIRLGIVEH